MIPDKVNILGFEYEIRQHDIDENESDSSFLGYCDFSRLRITIDNKSNIQQQNATLLHEIIEAINFHNELKLEHNIIKSLETGLYQVLSENDLVFTKETVKNSEPIVKKGINNV
jgi:predicted DNA-binding protein